MGEQAECDERQRDDPSKHGGLAGGRRGGVVRQGDERGSLYREELVDLFR